MKKDVDEVQLGYKIRRLKWVLPAELLGIPRSLKLVTKVESMRPVDTSNNNSPFELIVISEKTDREILQEVHKYDKRIVVRIQEIATLGFKIRWIIIGGEPTELKKKEEQSQAVAATPARIPLPTGA